MEKFSLICAKSGERLDGKPFLFGCPNHKSLARSEYLDKKIELLKKQGIWRYLNWLPVRSASGYREKPLTYRSKTLGEELNLDNLYISFNGYWPEREVRMETCTFKELEGAVTVQYAKESGIEKLVVASAGNTAKAFAATAAEEHLYVLLVIPEKCLCGVYLPRFDRSYVRTIILVDGDYSDSISLAQRISKIKGYTYEGGASNIARRDGLGIDMLDAAFEIGRIPDHYFQAVGSGTGAIAAFEAAQRLNGDGRFGGNLPTFHLSQNLPVAPMYSAWQAGRREIVPELDIPEANNVLDLVYARVLSNRYPPYGVAGGVFDTLAATNGEMYGIENREARRAKSYFEKLEGVDILPAAAVNVAALIQAIEMGRIGKKDVILLNVTGGGTRRLRKDKSLIRIKEDLKLKRGISDSDLRSMDI